MIELNVRFQENYKRLDALCKDIFSSKDGVTTYITEMDHTYSRLRNLVFDWDTTYKQLNHMRWIRNQLAHEVGAYEAELCTKTDIDWLNQFYNSILKTTDPLAIVGKAERKNAEQKNYEQNYTEYEKNQSAYNPSIQQKSSKKSLWTRIKTKIKQWLSKEK